MKKKLGIKQIRKTSVQAQQNRVNNKKIKDNEKEAFKQATILYANEKKKMPDGVRRGARITLTNNTDPT